MEAPHFSNTQMYNLLPLCSWPRPNCLFEILLAHLIEILKITEQNENIDLLVIPPK